MKNFKLLSYKLISLILACTMLQGCATTGGNGGMSKQGAGTAIGVVAGGLLGSRFGKGEGQLAAAAIGALAGGFIGGSIGKNMDENDKRMLALTSQKALETAPSGSAVEWNNPDSGNYGSVQPVRTFKDQSGQYCREYSQTVVVAGKQQKAYGMACRQPDGQWKITQ